ncbi:MAG TPA: hypothetical protein DCY03_20625 [Planctomycetaceae bacterium]|nr:hypothetical protein [Planctomycetaceae bacterium]|tara:strand:+ start:2450 stop:3166 length:717 start_codon:yes stop_codon:yes gene_type:complete
MDNGKKDDVNNSDVELQEFRASFEQASREHDQKGKWAGNLFLGSLLLEYALIWLKCNGTSAGECMSPAQSVVVIMLFLLPIILFFWYLFRICSNSCLKCPLCSVPLYHQLKEHLLTTGMCPHCRQIIMAGTLPSAEAANAYYAEQKIIRQREDIIGSKNLARTTFWSAIIILPLSIPMYYWMKSLEEVLGQETSYGGVKAIFFMSAVLILLSVFCKRSGKRRERKLNEKLRQEESAHE